MLARNDGLIRFLIIAENDGFFIIEWYAIPEYSACVFAAITAGVGHNFSGCSIHYNPDPNFVFSTEYKGPWFIHLQHRYLFWVNGLQLYQGFVLAEIIIRGPGGTNESMEAIGRYVLSSHRKDTKRLADGVFDRTKILRGSSRHQAASGTAGAGRAARRPSSPAESSLPGAWCRFRRRLLPGVECAPSLRVPRGYRAGGGPACRLHPFRGGHPGGRRL